MKFFKISKKIPQKTKPYIYFADPPEGNTVVCIAQNERGDKKILLKKGDIEGNETLYENIYSASKMEQTFDSEIDTDEEGFAISREIFCAELIQLIDPACSVKYSRYYTKDSNEPLIGAAFIDNFRSWRSCYDYVHQTISGYKVNLKGFVEFPQQHKRIRGLGSAAVLLILLGKDDRGGENWGLIEKNNHLQVTLIDFGRCLSRMLFSDKQPNISENAFFTDPFDLVRAVFQQYFGAADEPPLPKSFWTAVHTKYEVFETIDRLYQMPFSMMNELVENNFKQFPLFKKAILEDRRMGIELLYNQFKDNKEYLAARFINRSFKQLKLPIRLSDLDNISINYLVNLYMFINPEDNPHKEQVFFNYVSTFLIEEKKPHRNTINPFGPV